MADLVPMTAPERIWADPVNSDWTSGFWDLIDSADEGSVAYVRADIAAAEVRDLDQAWQKLAQIKAREALHRAAMIVQKSDFTAAARIRALIDAP